VRDVAAAFYCEDEVIADEVPPVLDGCGAGELVEGVIEFDCVEETGVEGEEVFGFDAFGVEWALPVFVVEAGSAYADVWFHSF